MVSKVDRYPAAALAFVAAAVSAVLFFFGTGLHPVWALTWLAPFPVLWMAPRAPRRPVFVASVAAWFAGSLTYWTYLLHVVSVPPPVVFAFSTAGAIVFALAVLAYRTFSQRGALWMAALAPATIWTAYEYATSVVSPHGTFGNLAYSQMNCLPVLQLASITGVWGIDFLLLFAPSVAATGKKTLAAAAAVVFAAVLGYGFWRYAEPPAQDRVTIALIASDTDPMPRSDEAALRLMKGYVDAVERVSKPVAVFLLPEKIAVVPAQAVPRLDAMFGGAAQRTHSTIIAGVDRITGRRRANEARVYSPQGTLTATYQKHHLIPGFEDIDTPGTATLILHRPSGTWGIQICKDLDFPSLSREYGRAGAGLVLVPAWDFITDAWLHGRMAMMRGVESGFTVVRAAKEGTLTVSDRRGVVLAESNSHDAAFTIKVVNAPVSHRGTVYALAGDWFAWANCVLLIAVLVMIRRRNPGLTARP